MYETSSTDPPFLSTQTAKAENNPAVCEASGTAESTASPGGEKTQRSLAGATVAASFAVLAWSTAATLMSDRGFDVTDEGYYLLSYRWWNQNLQTFTGAQYLYGPVFELLHYDIAALRMFRLSTVLVTHALFGWHFMQWLRTQRPHAPRSILWECAGTASLVASAGVVYGWLPLSPGYNDIAVLGSLLAATLVFRVAVDQGRNEHAIRIDALSLGGIAIVMLLTKWTSAAVVLTLVSTVLMIELRQRGWRHVGRFFGLAALGAAATASLLHMLVVPLNAAVPEMVQVNQLVASQSNSPMSLLSIYMSSSIELAVSALTIAALPAIAFAAAIFIQGRSPALAGVAGIAGIATLAVLTYLVGGFEGGSQNVRAYAAGLAAMFMLVMLIKAWHSLSMRASGLGKTQAVVSAPHRTSRSLVLLLLALPIAQAVGTGNQLYAVAVHGYAAWVAVLLVAITSMTSIPTALPRQLALAVVGSAVLAASTIGATGLMNAPYRTSGYWTATAAVKEIPALASLQLDPATVRSFRNIHGALAAHVTPMGRPMMAFDEMPGLVLALDGIPVGEAWYSRLDRLRTASGIRYACRAGNPWDRQPILFFNRAVTTIEVKALKACELDFHTDYRRLHLDDTHPQLRVYVPRMRGGEHASN